MTRLCNRRHLMLRKSGATAGKITDLNNTIEQEHICDDCSSCFSPCLTLKDTKSISLADLLSSSIYNYTPNHPEKHPIATLCFSTAAAAAPPSASHPRRPRPDGAELRGSERPRRCGRAADLCRGHGGRGRQRRPWPRKGFRVVLGVALAR